MTLVFWKESSCLSSKAARLFIKYSSQYYSESVTTCLVLNWKSIYTSYFLPVIYNLQVTTAWQIPINFFTYSHFANSEKRNTRKEREPRIVCAWFQGNLEYFLFLNFCWHHSYKCEIQLFSKFLTPPVTFGYSGCLLQKKHVFFHHYSFFDSGDDEKGRYFSTNPLCYYIHMFC